MKQKTCAHCAKPFIPARPMQAVCGPRCAVGKVKADKAKGRRELKARKEAMKTLADLTKEAQVAFNAFIRWRDRLAGHGCISCGQPLNWGAPGIRSHQVDAGHYRSRGSAPHLRFDDANCHAQCVQCNRYGSGMAVDYRIGLIERIGLAEVERLEADNTPKKITREELSRVRETCREKLKALKNQPVAGIRGAQ